MRIVRQAKTADALRFLSPTDGPTVFECSCLARCDRGAAVGMPSGVIEEKVNGAPKCAKLLRGMGYSIDQRLPTAYAAAQRGDELVELGREPEALNAYKRAFSLAIAAGLGLKYRNKPRRSERAPEVPWPYDPPAGATQARKSAPQILSDATARSPFQKMQYVIEPG